MHRKEQGNRKVYKNKWRILVSLIGEYRVDRSNKTFHVASLLVNTHQLEEQILQKCFICLNQDDAILIPADILYTGNNVGLG